MTFSHEQQYVPSISLEGHLQSDVTEAPSAVEEYQSSLRRYMHLGATAAKGAALGPFQQLKEIGGEVKQAIRDYRAIKEMDHSEEDSFGRKVGFTALKFWYALPFPAYQIADDTVTYPMYLQASEQFNSGTAYGIAAGATLTLATVMGLGQRRAEMKKAELVHATTEKDTSDIVPPLLDASVNSGPWQVARKANEPREEGEPIKLVGQRRVLAFAGSYALVNTGLYAAADYLPVNEWVGFGVMLAGVWSANGAYRAVKEEVNQPVKQEQTA